MSILFFDYVQVFQFIVNNLTDFSDSSPVLI